MAGMAMVGAQGRGEIGYESSPLQEVLRHGMERRERSRLALAFSIAIHIAIGGSILFASYRIVSPPPVKPIRVFMPTLAPPPPPPPAPAGHARATPAKPVEKQPTPRSRIVAPPEIPRALPTPEPGPDVEGGEGDSTDGVIGGVKGGVKDGVFGGVLNRPGGGAITGATSDDIISMPPSQARLTKKVEPLYPPLMRRVGVPGTVVLEAVIGTDGRVQDLVVMQATPGFEAAARAAVSQWEFEPATRQGRSVRMRLTVTVEFVLQR